MKIIVMPSPNGTNREQLYIPQHAAAYDAKTTRDDAYHASQTYRDRINQLIGAGYTPEEAQKVIGGYAGDRDQDNACPRSANMQPTTRQRLADAIASAIERHSVVKDEDPMENDGAHWIEKVLEYCEGKMEDDDMKGLAVC